MEQSVCKGSAAVDRESVYDARRAEEARNDSTRAKLHAVLIEMFKPRILRVW